MPRVSFHYNGPAGEGELQLSQIVTALRSHPAADHYVWKAGWDGWKLAKDVPEIAAAMASAAPPPPPRPPGPPPIGR
jgi:hypothetical protein